MKIAVVGSGISGIYGSFLLDKNHDVSLYERRERLGGHSHTVDVTLEGRTEPVDTGFIVFNDKNYPLFSQFLDDLSVDSKPAPMSFSFSGEQSGLEYGGSGLKGFFAQKRNLLNPAHWYMLAEIIWFYVEAPSDRQQLSNELTLAEYLDRKSYTDRFVDKHLLPMVSAIWSVPVETAREFPFSYVVDFFRNHGLLSLFDRPQWRTIIGGSRKYLKKFREKFTGKIITDNPVQSLVREPDSVELHSNKGKENFDAVVLAVHSDQALETIDSPTEREVNLLSSISYESNHVTLHTDEKMLPDNETIWSSWNYHRPAKSSSKATITYDLSVLQDLSFDHEVCVTLNGSEQVDSEDIIDEFEYSHPVYTSEAVRSRDRMDEINGNKNIYFSGAWLGDGFHEDGAESAYNVVNKIGG